MQNSLANWQWLVPLKKRNYAAVIIGPETSDSECLVSGFDNVTRYDVSEARVALGDAHLDCVAVLDANRVFGSTRTADLRNLARCIFASLEDRGGVYVGIECSRWSTRGKEFALRRSALCSSVISRHLVRAGFSDVRYWYVMPAPETPYHIVPIDRAALTAWDYAMDNASLKGVLRRLLIMLGLHRFLFQYRLVIARP